MIQYKVMMRCAVAFVAGASLSLLSWPLTWRLAASVMDTFVNDVGLEESMFYIVYCGCWGMAGVWCLAGWCLWQRRASVEERKGDDVIQYRAVLLYTGAFVAGVGLAILSWPLTWTLAEGALYLFGHKLGLNYSGIYIAYFVCWGMAGVCCLAAWRRLVRVCSAVKK